VYASAQWWRRVPAHRESLRSTTVWKRASPPRQSGTTHSPAGVLQLWRTVSPRGADCTRRSPHRGCATPTIHPAQVQQKRQSTGCVRRVRSGQRVDHHRCLLTFELIHRSDTNALGNHRPEEFNLPVVRGDHKDVLTHRRASASQGRPTRTNECAAGARHHLCFPAGLRPVSLACDWQVPQTRPTQRLTPSRRSGDCQALRFAPVGGHKTPVVELCRHKGSCAGR
jgi:hypothetical protein